MVPLILGNCHAFPGTFTACRSLSAKCQIPFAPLPADIRLLGFNIRQSNPYTLVVFYLGIYPNNGESNGKENRK